MTKEHKIQIIDDMLKRFRITKSACDSCIPDELIECFEELKKDIEELESLRKEEFIDLLEDEKKRTKEAIIKEIEELVGNEVEIEWYEDEPDNIDYIFNRFNEMGFSAGIRGGKVACDTAITLDLPTMRLLTELMEVLNNEDN